MIAYPPFVFIGQGRYTSMFPLSSEIAGDSRSRQKRGAEKHARLKVTRFLLITVAIDAYVKAERAT